MPEIIASLKGIRFQGDNNFIIGIFESDPDGEFGGLGNILSPKEGMTYKLNGDWSNHSDFGKQFKFNRYYVDKPIDTNGLYLYLVKNVPGVGPAIANDLIYEFDVDALKILENDPQQIVKKIKGITLKKAINIQEWLVEESEDQELMIELMGLLDMPGLRKNLPHDLIQAYGSDAAGMLKKNPYIITNFNGTGFLIADKLAICNFKIDPNDFFRIKSAILYCLKQNESGSGSTWAVKDDLQKEFYELTGVCAGKFNDGLFELEIDDQIIDDENGLVALAGTAEKEKFIASKLIELMEG